MQIRGNFMGFLSNVKQQFNKKIMLSKEPENIPEEILFEKPESFSNELWFHITDWLSFKDLTNLRQVDTTFHKLATKRFANKLITPTIDPSFYGYFIYDGVDFFHEAVREVIRTVKTIDGLLNNDQQRD